MNKFVPVLLLLTACSGSDGLFRPPPPTDAATDDSDATDAAPTPVPTEVDAGHPMSVCAPSPATFCDNPNERWCPCTQAPLPPDCYVVPSGYVCCRLLADAGCP